MNWFDRLRGSASGDRNPSAQHLAGYRRLGEQVYSAQVELANCEYPKALALLTAAKSFQVMGDALLQDILPSSPLGEEAVQSVPVVTFDQAEAWYSRIPDLLTAARQEAAYPGSSKVNPPVQIGDRMHANGPCPITHLTGMRLSAENLSTLYEAMVERRRQEGQEFRSVILLYEEARTARQSADALIGSIARNGRVSKESHEEAENLYWRCLTNLVLIGQGLHDAVYAEAPVSFHRASSQVSDLLHGRTPNIGSSFDGSSNGPTGTSGINEVRSESGVDFGRIEQQATMVQQHNGKIVEQLQQVIGTLQAMDAEDKQKQDMLYALRELALSVRGLNQETTGMVQSMALYIQHLEQSHPNNEDYQRQYPNQQSNQPSYNQPNNQPYYGNQRVVGSRSGGFWDTIVRSAEMGAGFEIGADIVDNLFGRW